MSVLAIESPSDIASALTGRDYISYSAISTYQACPLRYYFRYIAKLPEKTVSAALIFGGAIHRAVELHFREVMAGNPAPDLDMMLAEYQTAWAERDDSVQVQFGKGESLDTLGQLAERMIAALQQSDFAAGGGKIIGVEEELRSSIVPGCPELLARVDLISETEDELIATDLKTARSRWSQSQVDSSAGQLLIYSELARNLAPGKKLHLRFVVVTKAKQPSVDSHDVAVDPARIVRTKRTVQRVWQSIEAQQFYPAPSPLNCAACPFKEPCRRWQG
ncbi:MAG: PD-(D/E)XK nuclease family protein [Planctomycetota bacterium]|nr:MAG: PD-(D/E)XK nuclease family protein [Planctomycetota bacterium]REJ87312.1 MAG: PD-(D/E)XK nuclease family protein [Planctomycetota bacterium]REK22675.1 MAG: PD-(D/E)XK nuclease family protein [Planctomycetota bacterium]REK42492.1 MAG: PD-(D/E)XK nuclease family protein [Planctomycetota bacterium]